MFGLSGVGVVGDLFLPLVGWAALLLVSSVQTFLITPVPHVNGYPFYNEMSLSLGGELVKDFPNCFATCLCAV